MPLTREDAKDRSEEDPTIMLCPECGEVVAPGPMCAKAAFDDAAPAAGMSIRDAERTGAAKDVAHVRLRAFRMSHPASLTCDAVVAVNG